eukprot:c5305_g1_i3.p1 GENE.c5305_g1_i3~~c5305_g1_i3.p1  ORF type:complete len:478 (+),score=89.22 c5305_g1_i3:1-1434(+)
MGSTNIAETSITIDDIVFVIDTGRVKENRFILSTRTAALIETWASQASVKQRKGRAGRVRPGVCFHLFPRSVYNEDMRPFTQPEILRAPLTEICLQLIAGWNMDQNSMFADIIDPPSQKAVSVALSILHEIKAIDKATYTVTPLGRHLSFLPVDVRIGKMILFGAMFHCLDPVLTVASVMSLGKSPFFSPIHLRDEAKQAKAQLMQHESDQLTVLRVFTLWKELMQTLPTRSQIHPNSHPAESSFCRKHFVNATTLRQIVHTKQHLLRLIKRIGFVPSTVECDSWFGLDRTFDAVDSLWEANSSNIAMIKSILCSGLYPNIVEAKVQPNGTLSLRMPSSSLVNATPIAAASDQAVHLHPSSVVTECRALSFPFLVYQTRMMTKRLYLHEVTSVSPIMILLFGAGNLQVLHTLGKVVADGMIDFELSAKTAVLLKAFRQQLDSILDAKISDPSLVLDENAKKLIEIVLALLDPQSLNK